MLLCLYCQVKKTHQKISKQKCLQQEVCYIEGKKEENKYECRKRR